MLMYLVIVVATIPGGRCSICCSKAGGPCCFCLVLDILIPIILNNYYNYCYYGYFYAYCRRSLPVSL